MCCADRSVRLEASGRKGVGRKADRHLCRVTLRVTERKAQWKTGNALDMTRDGQEGQGLVLDSLTD